MSFKFENEKGVNDNIWFDKELYYAIEEANVTEEEKNYMVLALVGLIMIARGEEQVFTTPEVILATMCNTDELELKPKAIKGFIKALNDLDELDLIGLSKEVTKAGQLVKIETSAIVHEKGDSFFQITREEIEVIMTSSTPQNLIRIFNNFSSRWNMESYRMYEEFGWNKTNDRYYDTDIVDYKYLSCYPTYEELNTTWCSRPNKKDEKGFNCIECSTSWEVSKVTMNKYIDELINLGLICKITRNSNMRNHNYYCRPQHEKVVSEVLDILALQQKYEVNKMLGK